MSSDDAFLKQLRATFRVEAEEHLQTITTGLLRLERDSEPARSQAIVEDVFRAAHSLKGAARAVDLLEAESACQSLEEIFAAWKRGESQWTPQLLDQLHTRVTRLAAMVGARGPHSAQSRGAPAAPLPAQLTIPASAAAVAVAPRAGPDPVAAAGPATVRVRVAALDARLIEAEEMLTLKLGAGQRVEQLRELTQLLRACRGEFAASGGGGALEQLQALERKVASLVRAAEHDRGAVAKVVDELLTNSKRMLLMPFATLAAPLPKLLRDLCREQGKDADLQIEGEDIVLDKGILDTLKDPLIHLLRNCVDHGIETPGERARCGKPSRAQVRLTLRQLASNKVQITLADDGRGIDAQRVRASAVKHGAIAENEAAALPDAQARALIFRSGVSTSGVITRLSGRGLGLAIVHEKALRLGGDVSVESRPGNGTLFRIVVPAMRATFRGILVQAAGRMLVLPTAQVERATRTDADGIRTVEGRDTMTFDGCVVPIVRLAQVLGVESALPAASPAGAPVLIVGSGSERVALAVDQLLDEQEFLVKPLPRPLMRVRNVESATVLPSGSIACILHVGDLLASARRVPALPPRLAPTTDAPPARKLSVLLAEDSITSRMLIKGILESAGYRVTLAVDGLDAFDRLRSESFDLVVSDIEMPRLNGFDLTARIRAHPGLAYLPVVLVTTLDRREDRERGVEAGASAYIVKGSFDQSTLVETLRRLV